MRTPGCGRPAIACTPVESPTPEPVPGSGCGGPPTLEYASHAFERPWIDGPSELRRARGVVPVPAATGCGVPAAVDGEWLPTPGITSVCAAGLVAGGVDGVTAIRGSVL